VEQGASGHGQSVKVLSAPFVIPVDALLRPEGVKTPVKRPKAVRVRRRG
jgi:hypothetical protein